MSMATLPAWDNTTEYASVLDSGFEKDRAAIESAIREIDAIGKELAPLMAKTQWNAAETETLSQGLVRIHQHSVHTGMLHWNLVMYAHGELAVDANNEEAKKANSRLQMLSSKRMQALQPFSMFLMRSPESFFQQFIQRPECQNSAFNLKRLREQAELLLSEGEEKLMSALTSSGHTAWGDLYDAITGNMKCTLKYDDGTTETIGFAQAQALTKMPDGKKRKAAWQAIQDGWTANRESGAAILNALAGWRLENASKRSHTRKIDFLDTPLFESAIKRETLTAMMGAIEKNKSMLQDAVRTIAACHGKGTKLPPWDLLAPAPLKSDKVYTYAEAIKTIRDAFASIDESMGQFVDMMVEKCWVEARVLPTKQGGAFCMGFPKTRTPRVFQTFMGSFQDVSTLAHELGHAYHSWVMRDLPFEQSDYPMTLAETASIFCETVLTNALITHGKTADEKFEAAYAEAEGAVGLLLNIPTRFDFEKSFYEKRKEGFVSADELSKLTDAAWTKWYGDSLTVNDKMFWATKAHFSFASVSFYNYPYSFGHLFALSIYARRKTLGDQFLPTYHEILRDTGRMTAEDLIKKHLGEDIGTEAFWQKSLDVVKAQIENFKGLAAQRV